MKGARPLLDTSTYRALLRPHRPLADPGFIAELPSHEAQAS